MKCSYSFSVLRYVHDPVTQEFVNIGVALFAPDARYLRARCTTSYSRARHLFGEIDRRRFRQISRYIEERINEAGRRYQSGLALEPERTIEPFLARVLPPDDSAFQFSLPGAGLSRDLGQTLDDLFQRHVARYAAAGEAESFAEDLARAIKEHPPGS